MTAQQEPEPQKSTGLTEALATAPLLDRSIPVPPTLEPSPLLNFGQAKADFAAFHESYVRHYIALADTKAGVIFTLTAGVLGYLINIDEVRAALLAPAFSKVFVFSGLALLFLGAAATLSFLVIAPRLSSASNEGLVFFGAVAARERADQYLQNIAASSEEDLTKARISHCYDVSKICSRKYGLLKKAIWLTPVSLILALSTTLIT
jgi:hypothetical protein